MQVLLATLFLGLSGAVKLDYDYLLFENMEGVRRLLEAEAEAMAPAMIQLRDSLRRKRERAGEFLERPDALIMPEEDERKARTILSGLDSSLPSESEVDAAVRALVFLFDSYKLSYSAAAEGKGAVGPEMPAGTANFQASERLSASDLNIMAAYALREKMFDVAIDILREMMLKMPEKDRKGQKKRAKKLLKKAVKGNNDNLMRRPYLVGRDYQTLPWLIDESFRKLVDQSSVAPKRGLGDSGSEDTVQYYFRHSCRGSAHSHPFEAVPPRCRMLHQGDPFLRLGPHRMEVVSGADPYVVQFHDFLSEREIRFLVDYAKPRLSSVRLPDDGGASNIFDSNASPEGDLRRRIVAKTVQAWVSDVDFSSPGSSSSNFTVVHPALFGLTRKMEAALGMDLASYWASANYQVTNYGLAGLVEPHVDPHGYLEGAELPPSRADLVHSGDILATAMGYLSEVEGGGATTFLVPNREVTVWPRRGSISFWFSLTKEGRRDMKTIHGGCPVLKGSKWIFNKWIYLFDQFKNYPCSLKKGEVYRGFTKVY